jgi:hypothetical protein
MSTYLCLGVMPIPYDSRKDTFDVATILEDRYGIMQKFYELNSQQINDDMAEALSKSLEDFANGFPVIPLDRVMAQTLGEKSEKFRDFLDTGEVERVGIPGTPTKRSLQRISLRFKNKKTKKGKRSVPRSSFLDTLLYRNSFRMWIDER